MLPGPDGWEITRRVRADSHLASIPILMLTARVDDTDKIHGLDVGADDYLTKPFNPEEVVARVRAILRRTFNELQPAHVLVSGGLRLDMDEHSLTLNDQWLEVTPTEFAILHVLMQHPNRTFTRDELIEQALGYSYEGLGRTLDSHIKNLRKKIEPQPEDHHYIETVFGVGYRFREDTP
jgi:two-component system alkaline phosphatase synthesis response regulator PhoP